MDRRAQQATVHGVARVGHDLATKPPPILVIVFIFWQRVPDLGRKWLDNQGPHLRTPAESASHKPPHVFWTHSPGIYCPWKRHQKTNFSPASVSPFGTKRVNLPWRLLWDKEKGQRGLTPISGEWAVVGREDLLLKKLEKFQNRTTTILQYVFKLLIEQVNVTCTHPQT